METPDVRDFNLDQFERRKQDHIRLALNDKTQTLGLSGLDRIQLVHEAIPDLDFADISLETVSLTQKLRTPLFVSSMTAGHKNSEGLNRVLARACAQRGWPMGVGSQRRELNDATAAEEWRRLRRHVPGVQLMGNLGLSQVIHTPLDQIRHLVDSLEAMAMIVHTNPLQEALQPEGTPQFKGGLKALEQLCKSLSVPVILKETGCGFSRETVARLKETGLAALDISGLGGTHWGRIEGWRSDEKSVHFQAAQTFRDWGISTVESLMNALTEAPEFEVWASGGVRSGLDAAKLLAMGGRMVGLAAPMMGAALRGEEVLVRLMEQLEFELKVSLFCTGCQNIREMKEKQVWQPVMTV